MAFIRKNFQPIGGQSKKGIGGAPAVYSYKTADTHATVDTLGYFNGGVAFGGVWDLLAVGDIIDVVVVTNLDASNEALSTYGRHVVVTRTAAGVVNVSDVTVGTVTNTD